MTMKSQIYAAYVAGLCPHQLLLRYRPDDQREPLPIPADVENRADLPRVFSRRKRAVLLAVTLCFAIGAWQFLSRTGQAAERAAGGWVTQTSALGA